MNGHATYGRMVATHQAVRLTFSPIERALNKALGVRPERGRPRCGICNEPLARPGQK